jgi:hypothetical protein
MELVTLQHCIFLYNHISSGQHRHDYWRCWQALCPCHKELTRYRKTKIYSTTPTLSFHRGVCDILPLLPCYAEYTRRSLRTFRDNLSSLFCYLTQRILVVSCRRFGTRIFPFLLSYAAYIDTYLRTFRQNVSSLICHLTQRILIVADVSGQRIGPIFDGQHSSSTAWLLKMGPTGFPETPVTTNLRYVTSQKNDDLNLRHLWVV